MTPVVSFADLPLPLRQSVIDRLFELGLFRADPDDPESAMSPFEPQVLAKHLGRLKAGLPMVVTERPNGEIEIATPEPPYV